MGAEIINIIQHNPTQNSDWKFYKELDLLNIL